MRVLLDECVPRKLRQELSEYEVKTVVGMNWGGVKNGALLRLAASEFDVFLTVDQNLKNQQNLSQLPVSVIVLVAQSNDISDLRPLMKTVHELLPTLQERTLYIIDA